MFTEILLARGSGRGWWRFLNPFDVVSVRDVADVYPALQQLEARVEAEQCYAVGFVGYEAAPGFDVALTTRPAGRLPLLWFGLFHAPEQLDQLAPGDSAFSLPDWRNPQPVADYEAAVQGIRDEIAAGNVYQINYTLQLLADRAPGRDWFANVAADAPYGAYLESDGFAIACASPELFFELDGGHLKSRPMKGTCEWPHTTIEAPCFLARRAASARSFGP